MTEKLSFWTPVRYPSGSCSLSENLLQYSDSFFHWKGRVGVVISAEVVNGSKGVVLQQASEKSPFWKIALKVAAWATIVIPLIMLVSKIALRFIYSFHVHKESPQNNGVTPQKNKITGYPVEGLLQENGKAIRVKMNALLSQTVDVPIKGEEAQFPKRHNELTFAEVELNGRIEIVPIQKLSGSCLEKYTLCPDSPIEALYKIISTKPQSSKPYMPRGQPTEESVKFLINHPNNYSITAEKFIEYLQEIDSQGVVRLHKIQRQALLEVLELAKEKKLPINLHTVDPTTNKTLLNKWIGPFNLNIVEALLDLDPTIIKDPTNEGISFFEKAVPERQCRSIARCLWKTMKQEGVEPSAMDKVLFQTVFDIDEKLRFQAFNNLPLDTQKLFGEMLVFDGDENASYSNYYITTSIRIITALKN